MQSSSITCFQPTLLKLTKRLLTPLRLLKQINGIFPRNGVMFIIAKFVYQTQSRPSLLVARATAINPTIYPITRRLYRGRILRLRVRRR